ncbi:hypothetical protein CWB89_18655 [Pseudoalteromonas piscicida]|uniref:Uncharacterized protein n=1 Tax=Pseudoalteromonas piscicida TaxID=43662 RepID=A0AAQ2IRH7_PSEO7|nr:MULTISPECIES: hypothetical protein [Pseudoalteromonas]KJY85727.1 hypothetical protein TW75_19460 [Pseudoalteromonas piscicida]TMN35110.1 hypothetical protein CWB94_21435 [Pseudoalteromonas piscicida]TMN36185.1 hypothetical protein CWB95_18080 [Pseudoalteromonas piscicida]TMN47459.1 hypothetical protein CWB92_20020 [Pseudoalteromonas piscicida]TMN49968.1 hypothetical protein CWB93_21235 [Pseudoalteromonas piscicida]
MRLLIVALLVGFIGIAFWKMMPEAQPSHANVIQVSNNPEDESKATLELDTLEQGSKQVIITAAPIQKSSDFYAVNKVSNKAKAVLSAAKVLPQDLNNEAYIEFDLPTLRKLEGGDNFELLIPQTQESFVAEVTGISLAENGDKSVFGKVTGADGRFHTTVLTVGKDAVYGQLTAPSGNYVFESKDQFGWIAAKRDLYRSHKEEELHPHDSHDETEHNSVSVKEDIFQPKSNVN